MSYPPSGHIWLCPLHFPLFIFFASVSSAPCPLIEVLIFWGLAFMKAVLNFIPVLPYTFPAQARVYVYFLLWSWDPVSMPLVVLNIGTKDSETLSARETNNCVWTVAWTCWCRASAFFPSLPTVLGIAAHKFRGKSMHIFGSSLLQLTSLSSGSSRKLLHSL